MNKNTGKKRKKVTSSKEDYLKAIWTLSERRAENSSEASTRDLAEHLGVSPPAVSRMLKQMQEQNLVSHTPYYGVRLTEKGREVALQIVRRHRLLELFLTEILKYEPHLVHEEAERLEHHISAKFEQQMDALLNFPECCPHGSVIPRQQSQIDLK